jgi:hypothetical protein
LTSGGGGGGDCASIVGGGGNCASVAGVGSSVGGAGGGGEDCSLTDVIGLKLAGAGAGDCDSIARVGLRGAVGGGADSDALGEFVVDFAGVGFTGADFGRDAFVGGPLCFGVELVAVVAFVGGSFCFEPKLAARLAARLTLLPEPGAVGGPLCFGLLESLGGPSFFILELTVFFPPSPECKACTLPTPFPFPFKCHDER